MFFNKLLKDDDEYKFLTQFVNFCFPKLVIQCNLLRTKLFKNSMVKANVDVQLR